MYVKLNASSSQARGNFGGEHIRIAARNIDIIAGIQNERSHYLIESLDLLHFVQKDIVFPVVHKTRDYFLVKNLGGGYVRKCEILKVNGHKVCIRITPHCFLRYAFKYVTLADTPLTNKDFYYVLIHIWNDTIHINGPI
jgi:hypothetical protein